MSERMEALLAEQVELMKRTLANQERALAEQQRSIEAHAIASRKQQRGLRMLWVMLGVTFVAIFGSWAINLMAALHGR